MASVTEGCHFILNMMMKMMVGISKKNVAVIMIYPSPLMTVPLVVVRVQMFCDFWNDSHANSAKVWF